MKKTLVRFASLVLGTFALATAVSCEKDHWDYSVLNPNAIFTIKPDGESFYLQINDEKTAEVANLNASPYGKKEVRAIGNIKTLGEGSSKRDMKVYVNWMDTVLTKNTVPTSGVIGDDAKKYGTDPVYLIGSWIAGCEDGYLTLYFQTKWGNGSVRHWVNLVTGANPDDPYEVHFYHNAMGEDTYRVVDSFVAFRLDDLPDTEGKTVKLKVKYHSPTGIKEAVYDYKTRK